MHCHANDSHNIDKRPQPNNCRNESHSRETTTFDHGIEGMQRNSKNPYPRREIAHADEPALNEASHRLHIDLVLAQPEKGQEEGNRLLHVGEDEVVDEQQELVAAIVEVASAPPGQELVGEIEEER